MERMKPHVPSLGMGNQNGNLLGDPELNESIKGMVESGKNVLNAKATSEILKSIVGGDQKNGSGIPDGIGSLLTGVADAFKGSADINTLMMQNMLKNQGQGNGGNDNSMMTMLLIMQVMNQNQTAMMTMMKQMSEESKVFLAEILETERRHSEARMKDLEARTGSSPLDQQVHSQIVPMLFAKALEQANKSPLESLADLAEKSEKLKGVFKGMFGDSGGGEFSEGRLKMAALHNERLAIVKKHETDMEKYKHDKDKLKGWSEMAANAGQSILGALGGLGFMPMNNITPDDEAAAMAAMQ